MPCISLGRVLALDVRLEVVVLLSFVVAVGALLPFYVDVVLVGLVRRDVAVLLRLVVTVRTVRRCCVCRSCAS